MNQVDRQEKGGRFRALLERALRGDQAAAWMLIEAYGAHLLQMLVTKRKEQGELTVDPVRLVADLWEPLRPEAPAPGRRSARQGSSPTWTDGPPTGRAARRPPPESESHSTPPGSRPVVDSKSLDDASGESLDDPDRYTPGLTELERLSRRASASEDATVDMSRADMATYKADDGPVEPASEVEQIASARRRWKHLIVTPDHHRRIMRSRLMGLSYAEIATELGLAEPVVRRVIQQLTADDGAES